MRGIRLDRSIFLIIAILLVLAGAGVLIASYVRTDTIAGISEDGGQISLLFVLELPEAELVSELLYYDCSTQRAALFDIPANTGVVVESQNRMDGIDTVYWTDGIDAYREAVSSLVGAPVDFHLTFTLDSLEMMADLLEGVPLFVADIPREGPDAIPIPTGDVILDGAKLRQYISYAPEGERPRERIARSQKAVAGVLDRLGEQHELVSDRATIALISDAVGSNLDREALSSLARVLGDLEVERMITRQVEGTLRNVETDEQTEALLFPHQEGRWLVESVRQVVENLRSNEALRDENIVITLEILNGTSNSGLARRTAELYRSYGFDVVTVGNAARDDVNETVIVDHVGNDVFATRTADIIRASLIDVQADSSAGVDVTIVLGEDFDGRYVRD